jgi:PAS domain S-box-containing protein
MAVGIVVLIVAGVGVWMTIDQNRTLRNRVDKELLGVAQLKVHEIGTWRTERLADATSLADDPAFATAVSDWLSSQSAEDAHSVTTSLQLRVAVYNFSGAALLDADGRVLLGAGNVESPVSPEVLQAEADSLSRHAAVLTDLHAAPGTGTIHIDTVAAVLSPTTPSKALGWVVLREDASAYLYPLIQSWPVPSNTGETLLVRRDGDNVLFLNDLRNQPKAALKLRIPLADLPLPATQAILGREGIFAGTDYRGAKVIAALEPIPGSDWFIVSKMDTSEALGPVWARTALIAALIAVLLLAFVVSTGLLWQRSTSRTYAAAYEDSLAHHAVLQRFEYLVQQAQDGILLADDSYRIVEANDRASEIWGYPREEFLRLRFLDLVPPETRPWLEEHLQQVKTEGSSTHEAEAVRKDGSLFPVEVSDSAFNVDGQTLIQAIARDISERRRLEREQLDFERQIQHGQRLESLGVLAGGIAHDFNNILTAILGNADLSLHEMPLSAPGRQEVMEVVNASHKAAELCRQMLAYSGHGQFVIEDIDLRSLIEDMLNLVKSAIPKKVLLNLNLAKNLPYLRGDVGQINQVIMNLVINAAEAIGERSGVITISAGAQQCSESYLECSQPGDELAPGLYVTLEISDTGAGMDKETQARLFEPFFTTKFTGRGLGLSAVLGIVRGHRGAIRVYSEVGKGTTFKILLPAGEGTPEFPEEAAAQRGDDWTGSGTVLLADDEETIRALGTVMLERMGFRVLTADDGKEAVELFDHHRNEIALVILDLTMPRMGGEEALRELKQLDPNVRVVLSSGYAESDLVARFAGKGAAGFMQKPYTFATFRDKVKDALM